MNLPATPRRSRNQYQHPKVTTEFINACPTCYQHKPSHQAPVSCSLSQCLIVHGLTSLWTLSMGCRHLRAPTPSQQWDSPSWPSISPPKLLSAKGMAEVLSLHIGPQFTSIFWRELCPLFGENYLCLVFTHSPIAIRKETT